MQEPVSGGGAGWGYGLPLRNGAPLNPKLNPYPTMPGWSDSVCSRTRLQTCSIDLHNIAVSQSGERCHFLEEQLYFLGAWLLVLRRSRAGWQCMAFLAGMEPSGRPLVPWIPPISPSFTSVLPASGSGIP